MSQVDLDLSHNALTSTKTTFFELASEQRLSIILRLHTKSAKIVQLAKDLGTTMQEVHRNVNRLQRAGLVKKNSEGIFSLTTFGNTIVKQIPTLNYLSKYKEYFSEHTLGELPMKFIQRLGALDNCELVKGIVTILEVLKDIDRQAQEHIYVMIPQVSLDLVEPAVKRIKEMGVKFSYILPKNVIVPKGRKEMIKNLSYNELISKGSVERRMVDIVQVSVILNERKASVLFPNQKGETDMNMMFLSNDPLFHEWCLDYFRYRWHSSEIFDESKIKEI